MKKVWAVVIAAVVLVVVCIIGTTIDSCKRNHLKCFGSSQPW